MRSPLPEDPGLIWAVLAGPVGLVAVYLLYRSLAIGTMSILAPISATGVILPVIWGISQGDRLSGWSLVGISIAILGSLMAVMEKGLDQNPAKLTKGVGLAIGSAFFVGSYFILMDTACTHHPLWAAMIMRASALCALSPLVLFAKVKVGIGRAQLPYIVFMGIVDTLAAFCFAMATSKGMLSEVSVISALYPAVTVMLSALILKERIRIIQYSGVVLALTGVALISTF
jgi:drug/metabolite transporter (DMT)-like permease